MNLDDRFPEVISHGRIGRTNDARQKNEKPEKKNPLRPCASASKDTQNCFLTLMSSA